MKRRLKNIHFAAPGRIVAAGTLLALLLFSLSCRPEGVNYRVRIRGEIDRRQRSSLREISDTHALRHEPPAGRGLLRRRAERDRERFGLWLRSEGYFQSRVELLMDFERDPVRVVFEVYPGEPFDLAAVEFELVDGDELLHRRRPDPARLGLKIGERARFLEIKRAEERLERFLAGAGFAFATVEERLVRADHDARSVTVTYRVSLGPRVFFGPVSFEGAVGIEEDFLLGKLPWEEGDLFDAGLLAEYRRRLIAADLFSLVRVEPAPPPPGENVSPIEVEVRRRKRRTVGLGLAYNTDEGIGGKINWTHRNLVRRGERLDLRVTGSEIGYSAEAEFRRPDYLRYDQTLLLRTRLGEEETDAYQSRQAGVRVGIDRGLRPDLVGGAAIDFKYSRVRDEQAWEYFSLLSLPLRLFWDRSDDLLDPRRGWRINLGFTPFQDVTDPDLRFFRTHLQASAYLRLIRQADLAFRVAAGSVGGRSRLSIPADERFYAGGGASVRGYGYQFAGPLTAGNPAGGRSITTVGGELRIRPAESWGLVFFIDGGTVYEETLPRWGEDLFWGAGGGFRYFTPVGPIRLDLAFPLDRRPGIDASYQVYVSIGQAF